METSLKIAIPRLGKQRIPKLPDKSRVDKACINCRKRKVRCTGETPRCKHCIDQEVPCVYLQKRQDRLKTATEQNVQLVALLKDLSLRANGDDKQKIETALDTVEDDVISTARSVLPKPGSKRFREDDASEDEEHPESAHGEALVTGSVGSNEDLDLLDEDLLRSRESRATGFVGQNSEVQWLRSFKQHMGEDEFGVQHSSEYNQWGPPGTTFDAQAKRTSAQYHRAAMRPGNFTHVTDSTFYLDSDDLEVDFLVDQYDMPPLDTARRLFNTYMETVHRAFPIISHAFEEHFYTYCESLRQSRPFQVPDKWLAVLNLIFAIGAKYSHLRQESWRAEEGDHIVYMTRAVRILGMNNTIMILSAPDLLLIQATGLLGFYYLAIGHVSRAWITIGISLRFSLAVGLHLRNEDPSASLSKRESLDQMWWNACWAQSPAAPCIISHLECTVPLPGPHLEPSRSEARPVSKERRGNSEGRQSTFSSSARSPASLTTGTSFLVARIKIDIITQEALSLLYSPRTATDSWERIQQIIPSLLNQVDDWALSSLPEELSSAVSDAHTKTTRPFLDQTFAREQLLLAFYYQSTRILITRPCICRIDERIKDQSSQSVDFCKKTAEACVKAAQDLVNLLPDDPDPSYIYGLSPWWAIVHSIMQPMTVFLLEIAYGSTHTPEGRGTSHEYAKKLIRLLRAMRSNNALADRAYKIVADILTTGNARFQADVVGLLAEDVVVSGKSRFAQPYTQQSDAFSVANWQQDVTNPAPAAGSSTQFFDPTSASDNFVSDQYAFDTNYQMPFVYGNPFITTFDQVNPLSQTVGMDSSIWSPVHHQEEHEDDHLQED